MAAIRYCARGPRPDERRPAQEPLLEKELHVLSGEHIPGNGPTPDHVKRLIDLQNALLARIASVRRCTGIFQDSMSAIDASILDMLVQETMDRGDDGLGMLARLEEMSGDHGLARYIASLAALREDGLDIKHLPTEDKPLRDRSMALCRAENWLSQRGLHPSALVYLFPKVAMARARQRDRNIFQNICRHGERRNLLFIGRRHELQDFEDRKHGFRIWRAEFSSDMVNNRIVLAGAIHPSLEGWVRDFARVNGIVDLASFR